MSGRGRPVACRIRATGPDGREWWYAPGRAGVALWTPYESEGYVYASKRAALADRFARSVDDRLPVGGARLDVVAAPPW